MVKVHLKRQMKREKLDIELNCLFTTQDCAPQNTLLFGIGCMTINQVEEDKNNNYHAECCSVHVRTCFLEEPNCSLCYLNPQVQESNLVQNNQY